MSLRSARPNLKSKTCSCGSYVSRYSYGR